jgi:hypothetical protein
MSRLSFDAIAFVLARDRLLGESAVHRPPGREGRGRARQRARAAQAFARQQWLTFPMLSPYTRAASVSESKTRHSVPSTLPHLTFLDTFGAFDFRFGFVA